MYKRLILALAFVAGCAGGKLPADDDFTDLAGVDEKSDKFTGKMTIVGSIDYGQTQGPFSHKANKWSALKFAGDAGDAVTVDVKSANGDTVAWVLDNDMNIVAYNDDYGDGTNSHMEVTLPKNASHTHYIVTRDYYRNAMKFTVTLNGKQTSFDAPCKVDADCALVRPDCCGIQNPIGVRADAVDAYRASLTCPAHQICPAIAIRDNHAMAECQNNKCVAVLPGDIACGGRTVNPHACANGYTCAGAQLAVDGTGKCYQSCGGIAGFPCENSGDTCVYNPYDACDPARGGDDCEGICMTNPDCTLTGCSAGDVCTYCSGSYQCVPDGHC
jgi:hypothetical protein